MLGKIIKHEFRATWKKICAMYMIMIVSLFIAIISFNVEEADLSAYTNQIARIVSMISMFVLIVSMTIAVVIIFVLLCQRFYQSVYSNEGYLTHTLPVSKFDILNGKLITYLVWGIATILVIVPCAWGYICSINTDNSFADLFEFIGDYIDHCDDILNEMILPILNVLLAFIRFFLYIFACLSLGQLSNNHKIGMAVLWSFILRIGESIITAGVSYMFDQDRLGSVVTLLFRNGSFDRTLRNMNLFSFTINLTILVVYYVITALIMNKKVNLQ